MTSPFPGMDPYLEGAKWPDVHHKLTTIFSELITPFISPKYFASVETYTVEDTAPHTELGIIYPDVAVLKSKVSEPSTVYTTANRDRPTITPASVTIPSLATITVRIPQLVIRDVERNILITVIEILSPVNKRNPGLKPYQKKRRQLAESGVHLLEIDLLRRGQRPLKHPLIQTSHYAANLVRANGKTAVWSFNITDLLPVLPVPLIAPDADIPLDLGRALSLVYKRSYYRNSLGYSKNPPDPAFSLEELDWIKEQLKIKNG